MSDFSIMRVTVVVILGYMFKVMHHFKMMFFRYISYLFSFEGALYICTEDVFPTKRLHQIAAQFQNAHSASTGKIQFMDNIFIEHAADLVSTSGHP